MHLLLSLLLACDTGTLVINEGDDDAPVEPADPGDPADPSDPADPADPTDEDGPDDEPDAPVDPEDPPLDPLGDLTQKGAATVRTTRSSYETRGCELEYARFAPDGGSPWDVTVILTHGFMRDRGHVERWARHLASWGFDVVTPDLCHATILDADHPQNGLDLADLANAHLAGRRVVYIGHSAGGLASLLATTHDPDAVGLFGLDLVDSDDLARAAARQLTVPFRGLIAEPSWSCNVDNNGLVAYDRAPDAEVWRVADTTHCDFEYPTDSGCTSLCDWGWPRPAFTDAQQRDAIAGMMTAYVFWSTGLDARAAAWWTPGAPEYDAVAAGGLLEAP